MTKLLAVVLLALAAGAAGWFIAQPSEHAVSLGVPPQAPSTGAPQPTGGLPSGRSFEVWFARNGRVVEALRAHRATRRVATAALDALLAGPTRSERASGLNSEIPAGTRLLGIAIADGVARIDVTSDFESAATTRALQLRLAQVVFTATQFPTVKKVRFLVNGSPVATLDRAVGRDAYPSLTPVVSPLAGSWRRLARSVVGPLTSRASAWTGSELLLLGRSGLRTVFAAYEPARKAWRQLTPPRGLGRSFRVAWTGHDLIAWGSTLAAYDPASRRWRSFPSPPVSGPPTLIAWTGRELVGWTSSGGAAYRPQQGWRALPSAPLSGTSAWTGKELIVVSPVAAASFAPGRGWRKLPPPPLPRSGATAVWDGDELLVVGGRSAPPVGLAYSPATSSWRELAPSSGRKDAAAVWTGSRLLLWGGETGTPGGFVIPPHGLAYDPRADSWSALPQAPLRGRLRPVVAWTGRSMLLWGGDPRFADGAEFTPSSEEARR